MGVRDSSREEGGRGSWALPEVMGVMGSSRCRGGQGLVLCIALLGGSRGWSCALLC